MKQFLINFFGLKKSDFVSNDWLQERERKSSRVEFEGVSIQFPIKKISNDASQWNSRRLRNKA